MFNVIIHALELVSSKYSNFRILYTFASVLVLTRGVRNLPFIRSLRDASELETGLKLLISVCCPDQVRFRTKNIEKRISFPF